MSDGKTYFNEFAPIPSKAFAALNIKPRAGGRMGLSDTEYKATAIAAMQALIGCANSILATPDEIAARAISMADAMASQLLSK